MHEIGKNNVTNEGRLARGIFGLFFLFFFWENPFDDTMGINFVI